MTTALTGTILTTPKDDSVTSAKLNTAVLTGLTAETAIADADLVLIDDGAGGTLRKMTRGNLFKQPSFFAQGTSDMNDLADATLHLMAFANVSTGIAFDTHGYFDNTAGNYKWTPQIAGKYLVGVSVIWANVDSGYDAWVAIDKNGAGTLQWMARQWSRAANAYLTVNLTALIDFNGSTDYVQAYGFHGDTSHLSDMLLSSGNSESYFWSARVSS